MPEEKEQVDREDTTTEESSLTVTQRWRTDLRRRRILIVAATLLVVLIIIFAILFWRSRKTATTATTEEEVTAVVSVRVAKAEKQTIATQVNALGTIFPHDQALVAAKIGAQIKQMLRENGLWGAERVRGELLKLGIRVSKRTIQRYKREVHTAPAGQPLYSPASDLQVSSNAR